MTEKKGKIRKEMNEHDNEMGACFTEALLNYETVRIPSLAFLPVAHEGSATLAQAANIKSFDASFRATYCRHSPG